MDIRTTLIAIVGAVMILVAFSPALAMADDCNPPDNTTTKGAITSGANCASGNSNNKPASLDTTATNILNILSAIVGVAAVFMIILSGLRYITSSGNEERVKSAKRTLIYAVIGLAIVALTQTIVHFVLTEASRPNNISILLSHKLP